VVRYCNALPRSSGNVTSSGVQVTFQGRSPNAILTTSNGTSGQNQVSIGVGDIDQVSGNGTLVSSFPLPLVGYVVNQTTDSSNNEIFPFFLTVPGPGNLTRELELQYILFANDSTVTSAGISFPVARQALKLELFLTGAWASELAGNPADGGFLRFSFQVEVKPPVMSMQTQITPELSIFILQQSGSEQTTVRLLNYAVVDGINTPIHFNFTLIETTTTSSSYDLDLLFPPFTQGLLYDPDFSVTFGESASAGDGGGGDSPPDLLPLLSLISLVIPIAVVIAVVVTVVLVVIARRQYRAQFTYPNETKVHF